MTEKKNLAEHARDATGPYDHPVDLAADLPPVGGAWEPLDAATVRNSAPSGDRQSAKLSPGSSVEWGNPKSYGVVLEVNGDAGTALLQPAALDENGYLVGTGGKKLTKPLSSLRRSDKRAAADLSGSPSLEELQRKWLELTGEDFRRKSEDDRLWQAYEEMRDNHAGPHPRMVAKATEMNELRAHTHATSAAGPAYEPDVDLSAGGEDERLYEAWLGHRRRELGGFGAR